MEMLCSRPWGRRLVAEVDKLAVGVAEIDRPSLITWISGIDRNAGVWRRTNLEILDLRVRARAECLEGVTELHNLTSHAADKGGDEAYDAARGVAVGVDYKIRSHSPAKPHANHRRKWYRTLSTYDTALF